MSSDFVHHIAERDAGTNTGDDSYHSADRYAFHDASVFYAVPVRVHLHSRNISHVAVEIQTLRICKLCIRHGRRFRCPVRRDEPRQPVRVIACSEVVEAGFVAFFAGEFVVVGVVVDELKLAAPGVVVGFGLDVAQRVGDDRRGLEMVRE